MMKLTTRLSVPDAIIMPDRQHSIRTWMECRLALRKPFLALWFQNHNADSVPRRVTRSAWWKVHERYCAEVGGVEPEVIEEILADHNRAATRERELIRGTVDFRISLNDNGSLENRLAVLRKSICQ